MNLDSMPDRPLRGSEVDELGERLPFRRFEPARLTWGEASIYADDETVEELVVVGDEWFGALQYSGKGWEMVHRESCDPDEDPDLLYMVVLEELGLADEGLGGHT